MASEKSEAKKPRRRSKKAEEAEVQAAEVVEAPAEAV